MKYGDLHKYTNNRNLKSCQEGKMNEEEILIISEQILLALNFLHCANLVHRDLKPQNIMIEDPDTLEVKLADFGFATFFNNEK